MSDDGAVSSFESIPPARTLPTDLPDSQVLFLKIVSHPMIMAGKAAPWNWVLERCDDEDLDAEQILKELPRVGVHGKSYGFVTPRTTSLENREEIRPTVAASLILPDLRAAVGESFIRVLRYMVELHQNRPRSFITVTDPVPAVLQSSDLPQIYRGMRPEFIASLPTIFAYEPYIRNAGWKQLEGGGWEWPIDRSIRDYKAVATLADYVDRTCELTPEATYMGDAAAVGHSTVMRQLAARQGLDLLALAVPAQSQPVEEPQRVYVKEDLIAELEALDTDALHTDKLVQVLRELNFNFAHGHALSCNSLLRIALDTVPPAFGVTGFAQVAANYPWGKTDRSFLKKLVEFKDQGDDVMHRQIGPRRSRIDMHDMPAPIALNSVLDGLVVRLKELQKAATAP